MVDKEERLKSIDEQIKATDRRIYSSRQAIDCLKTEIKGHEKTISTQKTKLSALYALRRKVNGGST